VAEVIALLRFDMRGTVSMVRCLVVVLTVYGRAATLG